MFVVFLNTISISSTLKALFVSSIHFHQSMSHMMGCGDTLISGDETVHDIEFMRTSMAIFYRSF